MFLLSINLRNYIGVSQFNIVHRFCQFESITAKVKLNFKKSVYTNQLCSEHSDTVTIPIKVLTCIIETNKKKISGPCIVDAVTSLMNHYNQTKLKEISEKKLFYKILNSLIVTHINALEISEANEILKVLANNKINSSAIISSIVQHINNSLNNKSLQNNSKLSEIDYDLNNLQSLTKALKHSSHNTNNENNLNIINALLNDKFETIPVSDAISIMISLIFMKDYPPRWLELLCRIQNTLIDNMYQIELNDLTYLLKKLNFAINGKRKENFYNQKLFDSIIQKIISDNVNFDVGIECLYNLIAIRHITKKFLNFLSAKYYERKEQFPEINTIELGKLICLMGGLASLRYKSIFWEEIFQSLQNEEILNFKNEVLVNYSLNLACLDSYDSKVLNKIFNANYNFENERYFHWKFIKLWQKLKILPNYDGPSPSQDIIESFKMIPKKENHKLLSTLEKVLGHSKYIKTDLKSQFYHIIDHLIVFENKENPLAIDINEGDNKNVEYIEDLKIPINSQIIAVLYVSNVWFSRNSHELLGIHAPYVETLEALSCRTIIISEKEWNNLSEDSRTPFLMNKIKSKLSYSQNAVEIV